MADIAQPPDGADARCDAGAVVAWDDAYLRYAFADEHPLHPVRLALTMDLAGRLDVLARPTVQIRCPEPADDDLLTLAHDPGYLDAVRRASDAPARISHGQHRQFGQYGLGTQDNPIFAGMHESAALVAGGSVLAARAVWEGSARHAVNLAGGLHHAMPSCASGFCVYNDPVVAIRWLLGHGASRVAYVDVDVHHGDGVQAAFYRDPRVLTVSLHQDPLVLFPGTGLPDELGGDGAAGTSVNVALPAGTTDSDWLRAFHAVVPGLLRAFDPQVLVTQCGCDTYREDPLAGFALTVDGQRAGYLALHALAHGLCDGRWLALGGGGYALVRCVPRAWTHLLAVASGEPLEPATPVPSGWADGVRRRGLSAVPPESMTDGGDVGWTRWQPTDAAPLDLAIRATRQAVYPLHGLDPDDPRD